ncbi:MAG: hypothetical protein JWR66_2750 [Modestobacter sp.]|nr:hypothetical protein [Modestobacter sp.]
MGFLGVDTVETLDALARTLDRPDDPGLVATHRVVEWEARCPNRGHTEWLRVELEDDGAATRLTLRHAAARPRGVLRLFAGLSARMARMRLKVLAQAMARTASAEPLPSPDSVTWERGAAPEVLRGTSCSAPPREAEHDGPRSPVQRTSNSLKAAPPDRVA